MASKCPYVLRFEMFLKVFYEDIGYQLRQVTYQQKPFGIWDKLQTVTCNKIVHLEVDDRVLIEDIYLFLYTIVTAFSKQWKFTTFSRLFQDIFMAYFHDV